MAGGREVEGFVFGGGGWCLGLRWERVGFGFRVRCGSGRVVFRFGGRKVREVWERGGGGRWCSVVVV